MLSIIYCFTQCFIQITWKLYLSLTLDIWICLRGTNLIEPLTLENLHIKYGNLENPIFWFSTFSRSRIGMKLNASCSDGFSTQFWPPNLIFDFSGFWDTPTCRSRFEIWWIFMKILVFRTSFVRIWATEFVKIMIFSKKWFSGVYLHLMYPYIKKKVDREPTFRFLRGWLMKKLEKKWIFACPPPLKKSMTFRGVFDQIGSDIFLANFFAKIHFWVRIVSRGKKCCWTRCDNF